MDAQTLHSPDAILAFAGALIITVATALILPSKSGKQEKSKGAER